MKKMLKYIFLAILMLPNLIDALTYEQAENILEKYITQNDGYLKYFNSSEGGFLSKEEFNLTKSNNYSYLATGTAFWTKEKCVISDSLNCNNATSASVKVMYDVSSDTMVSGNGSQSNPWEFVAMYNVVVGSHNNNTGKVYYVNNDGTVSSEIEQTIKVKEGTNLEYKIVPAKGYGYSSTNCPNTSTVSAEVLAESTESELSNSTTETEETKDETSTEENKTSSNVNKGENNEETNTENESILGSVINIDKIMIENITTDISCSVKFEKCPIGTYSNDNSGCHKCPTGYTSKEGSTSIDDCFMDVPAGKYVASANASEATICAAGTYKEEHVVKYGATSSCNACPTGYINSAEGATAITECYTNVKENYHIKTSGDTSATACATGYEKEKHVVYYQNTSECTKIPTETTITLLSNINISDGKKFQTEYSYDSDNPQRSVVLPLNMEYAFMVWGAQGGPSSNISEGGISRYYGGPGGFSFGKKVMQANSTIYVYTGRKGGYSYYCSAYSSCSGSGGTNGGARGRFYYWSAGGAGGGGGATHISTSSGTLYSHYENKKLSNILIVAGGGGGGAWAYNYYNYSGSWPSLCTSTWCGSNGGPGGGYSGGNGDWDKYWGYGGYPSSYPYIGSGSYGFTNDSGYRYAGGGGGGYYGGHGGLASNNIPAGGGGGSGYLSSSLTDSYMCIEYSYLPWLYFVNKSGDYERLESADKYFTPVQLYYSSSGTKYKSRYSGPTSSPNTIVRDDAYSTPYVCYGKLNNGYARITAKTGQTKSNTDIYGDTVKTEIYYKDGFYYKVVNANTTTSFEVDSTDITASNVVCDNGAKVTIEDSTNTDKKIVMINSDESTICRLYK